MSASISASASAGESQRVTWMWKSNLNPFSTEEPEKWTPYSDVEIEIIEEAYLAKKSHAMMDGYYIDFRNGFQIAEDNPSKQRHIKRIVGNKTYARSSVERYTDHPITPGRPYGGQYGWIPPFIIEARKMLHLNVKQLPSNDGSIVPMIVEKAALGIIEEGRVLGRRRIGEKMAEQLRAEINNGIKKIWKCCAHLYSQEEFLYRKVNEVMRLVGTPEQEKIWRTKILTLGPFCLLLWDNPFNNKLTKNKTLYRGAKLNEEQIKMYENLSKQPHEYRTFQAFTSCSRERGVAENFQKCNALFIIHVVSAFTVDLEETSSYPEEKEELVSPGVNFRVLSTGFDNKKGKHLIYLQLRQRFDGKFS
jgi:hypothetical protein